MSSRSDGAIPRSLLHAVPPDQIAQQLRDDMVVYDDMTVIIILKFVGLVNPTYFTEHSLVSLCMSKGIVI